MLKRKPSALFVLLTITMLFVFTVNVQASPITKRLSGLNRYATSASVALDGWEQSEYAILANGENFPDALSSAPLAKKYNAPIILTQKDSLPPETINALQQLNVKNVFIIGGVGVISDSVENNLNTMGIKTTRLFGKDRFETGIKIAEQLDNVSEIAIVTGEDFPDALSISPIAAKRNMPIILIGHNVVPEVVKNYISSHNIIKTYVIGAGSSIDDESASSLTNVEKIMGQDKYERNLAIIDKFKSDLDFNTIFIASGENFPDGLTGSALAGKNSSPMLLIGNDISSQKEYFSSNKIALKNLKILGGTGVLKEDIISSLSGNLPSDVSSTATNNTDIPQNLIYETGSGSVKYKVYTSKSIDTLFIAAALYNNFKGNYLMPNSDQVELFKKTKEYFLPYANHPFIKNFGKYMDLGKGDGDVDSSILTLLLRYSDFPNLSPKFNVTSQQLPDSLKTKESQDEFLTQLKSFYNDSHAEDFFTKNSSYYDALTTYIKNNEDKSATIKLINAAVDYTGNKEKYYSNKEIVYCTLLSFYRALGSFYTVSSGNTVNFVSIQPAYSSTNAKQVNFNINTIAETSVHEYLHNFVNTPVYEDGSLINSLTKDKDKKNYCSQIYYSFPWNRITDESFVRAIEARLYKKVLSEDLAISDIINPETKYGFKYTQALYNKLDSYEKNRQSYPTINDFLPDIIKELYN